MSVIAASDVAIRTRNPIREIVDQLKITPNPDKEFVSLALGDPTTFGNLKLHQSCVDAVAFHLQSFKANGYPPSIGTLTAREAIVKEYNHPEAPITPADVILASGCSDALNLAIGTVD